MSVIANDQAAKAFPDHQRINGDTVVRIPLTGDRESIVGVWVEYSEDQLSSQRPKRETDEGVRIVRHGLLQVDRTQTVIDTDQWEVHGEIWQVQRLGPIGSGYREVYLQIDDKRSTRKAADRLKRVV